MTEDEKQYKKPNPTLWVNIDLNDPQVVRGLDMDDLWIEDEQGQYSHVHQLTEKQRQLLNDYTKGD
jgi:hypothetical protein